MLYLSDLKLYLYGHHIHTQDEHLRFEELRTALSQQRGLITLHPHTGAFAQSQHGQAMISDKFSNSLVPRLALVLAMGIGLQIMWIYVEWNEGEGLEAWRMHDRHVVGGMYGAGGHIGAGTTAHIGEALLQHQFAYQLHQLQLIQLLEQHKRVAAAHENCLCLAQCLPRIGLGVQSLDGVAPGLQCITHRCCVLVVILQCIRHKEYCLYVLAAQ